MSAMSFWEMAHAQGQGPHQVPRGRGPLRLEQLGQGLIEIPVDGDIGIRATALPDFHSDPADRIIVATALGGHRLVTADERILAWTGNLDRLGRAAVMAAAKPRDAVRAPARRLAAGAAGGRGGSPDWWNPEPFRTSVLGRRCTLDGVGRDKPTSTKRHDRADYTKRSG